MAGTGGMKKVMGTNKAVAMVALKPGMQPTKSPNMAEKKMTSNTYGSKTSQKAWSSTAEVMAAMWWLGDSPLKGHQDAPWQWDAQRFVKNGVHHQGHDE